MTQQREAGAAGFFASDPAHRGREIDAGHLDASACEAQRGVAGAAGEVAGGFDVRQNAPENGLTRAFEPVEMKGEELIVILGEPAIGTIGRGHGQL